MSMVRNVVSPSISAEGTSARPTQRRRRRRGGASRGRRLRPGRPPPGGPATAPPRRPPAARPAARSPTDHSSPWASRRRLGSISQRVGQQPDHAAHVAGPVEEVGVGRGGVVGRGQPALQQRRGGRDDEEGQAHGHGQQPQQREHLGARRPAAEVGHGERQEASGSSTSTRCTSAWRRAPSRRGGHVRVQVGQQQRGLEEDQRGVPHRRRAAEEGQHELGDHRLDAEDERRADHERGGEERDHARSLAVPGRGRSPAAPASWRGAAP